MAKEKLVTLLLGRKVQWPPCPNPDLDGKVGTLVSAFIGKTRSGDDTVKYQSEMPNGTVYDVDFSDRVTVKLIDLTPEVPHG